MKPYLCEKKRVFNIMISFPRSPNPLFNPLLANHSPINSIHQPLSQSINQRFTPPPQPCPVAVPPPAPAMSPGSRARSQVEAKP